jgi:DNA repair protein SbcC/Rad50
MKLFDRLRRPAWQHKDPTVRRRAVSDPDPRLVAALPDLAVDDPDPGVRSAALRRLSDVALLARRANEDIDQDCANAARERLIELLCGDGLPLAEREAVLASIEDPRIVTAVASDAADSALRQAALQRVQRPGLLFERCLADPDPALRQWLLQRIDSPDSLLRLAEQARRKDKALARAARERAEALQFGAGDSAALERRAQVLCERLERLARELPARRDDDLAQAQQEAADLAPRLSQASQARLAAYLDLADTAICGARGESVPNARIDVDEPAAVIAAVPALTGEGATAEPVTHATTDANDTSAPPPNEIDTVAIDTVAIEAELDRIEAAIPAPGADGFSTALSAARRALESLERATPIPPDTIQARCAALHEKLGEHRAAHERQRVEQQAERDASLEAALNALEDAIAQGHLADARAARRRIDSKGVPKPLRTRLEHAEQQIAQLETWQRWSGHSVRERLCQHAEALHGSGLHPDAVMQRVRELQDEWQRLDRLDGAAAPGNDSGPARRFRALCQRALAPTRAYFEKRGQLRGQRAAQVTALLQEVDVALDDASARNLLPLRRQVTDALRELDAVAPEQRSALGRALRERLARFDAARDAAREQALADKRRLLAKLRRELGQASPADAAALARQAQAEWKRLPRGDRAQEEPLWRELCDLVEPLFERVRDAESRLRTERAEAEAAAQAVLDELDALATSNAERLAHADAHLDNLVGRWRALAPAEPEPARSPSRERERGGRDRDRPRSVARRGHPLDARFEAAVARVQAARARLLHEQARQAVERLAEAGSLLDEAAAAEGPARAVLLQRFATIDLALDARSAWQPRATRIAEGTAEPVAEGDPGASDAVRAELAAGLESPEACAALRRREQMQRLAARMQGEAPLEPVMEVREALIALHARPGIRPAHRALLQARILAAYQALAASR